MKDRRLDIARSAKGQLADLSRLGLLTWAEVHPAQHLAFLYGEHDERVIVAIALAVRALRAGSLCVDLARVPQSASEWLVEGDEAAGAVPAALPDDLWPEPSAWLDAVAASPAVTAGAGPGGDRPLRLVDGLLYLERYWDDQETVRRQLLGRLQTPQAPLGVLAPPASGDERLAGQEAAVASALDRRLTVIAGGPGTGKTRVIGQIVDAFAGAGALVGLCAPTGKAAARMTESLRQQGLAGRTPGASTLHRLLGWAPGGGTRFRHDASNPLPHDLVVVDELSMVSMTLMARLLDALKPDARLVLVGDPEQLASVEAGAVLADLVSSQAMQPSVVRLTHNFRFAGDIQQLSTAIRAGDADAALAVLGRPDASVRLLDADDAQDAVRSRCVDAGVGVWRAASQADERGAVAALESHRLLAAHRGGPFGVTRWDALVRGWLGEEIAGYGEGEFYLGRPLMMTANTPDLGLYNGDVGVMVAGPAGRAHAVFDTGEGLRRYSPFMLDGLVSVNAMTIHKSQGSQFDAVTVVLPPLGSPLLTRELLYTAVTRARSDVLIVGTPEAVRLAIERPGRRTSGLASRLDAVG